MPGTLQNQIPGIFSRLWTLQQARCGIGGRAHSHNVLNTLAILVQPVLAQGLPSAQVLALVLLHKVLALVLQMWRSRGALVSEVLAGTYRNLRTFVPSTVRA